MEIGVEFQSMKPMRAQTSCYLSDDCAPTMPSPVVKPEARFWYAKAVKRTWVMAEASDCDGQVRCHFDVQAVPENAT